MTDRITDKNRILGLDAIRAICALWVFGYHIRGILHGNHEANLMSKTVWFLIDFQFNGPAAVSIFFVISGLVIHWPNRARIFSVKEHLIRRYIRVGGPLLVVLWIAKLLATRGIEASLPVWSIYCELVYYALYPLLLIAIFRIGWKPVIGASIIAALVLASHPDSNGGEFWTYGVGLTWILGLPLWLVGAWIAQSIDLYATAPGRTSIFLWRSSMWVVSSALIGLAYYTPLKFKFTMLAFGFPAAAWLVAEVRYATANGRSRLLEWAGSWSFSLYLCHEFSPLISRRLPLPGIGITAWLTTIIIGIVFSLIFFALVEVPFKSLAHHVAKNLPKSRAIASTLDN